MLDHAGARRRCVVEVLRRFDATTAAAAPAGTTTGSPWRTLVVNVTADEAAIERRRRRQVQRTVAEVGVRIESSTIGEVAVVDRRTAVAVDVEVWRSAVVPVQPGGEPGPDRGQWMAEPSLQPPRCSTPRPTAALQEADARVKQDQRPLTCPKPIGRKSRRVDPVGEVLDHLYRSFGVAERAGEPRGRPAREYTECRVRSGEPVADLVERAVTTEADHHLRPRRRRRGDTCAWPRQFVSTTSTSSPRLSRRSTIPRCRPSPTRRRN